MKEVLLAVRQLGGRGGKGALVTVIRTRGSTPRKPGAKMLILDDGGVVGTIGGGCVEAEIWQEAKDVIRDGQSKLVTYSLTADLAGDSGMICGGTMDLFIERIG